MIHSFLAPEAQINIHFGRPRCTIISNRDNAFGVRHKERESFDIEDSTGTILLVQQHRMGKEHRLVGFTPRRRRVYDSIQRQTVGHFNMPPGAAAVAVLHEREVRHGQVADVHDQILRRSVSRLPRKWYMDDYSSV